VDVKNLGEELRINLQISLFEQDTKLITSIEFSKSEKLQFWPYYRI
jgi:hypothetical protein